MSTPLFSVIIPVFNACRYLDETLWSARRQECTDIEIMVVDDCSTDQSMDIILRHAAEDDRVIAISTIRNSGGPATPKNIGLSAAGGKYVSFLDNDDVDHQLKLQRALQVFHLFPDAEAIFFDVFPMSEDGHRSNTGSLASTKFVSRAGDFLTQRGPGIYECSHRYFVYMATKSIAISTQGLVARREAFLTKVGPYDESYRILDDTGAWFRLARNCRILYVDEPLCWYRQVAGSVSAGKGAMKLEAARFHSDNYFRLRGDLTQNERRAYRVFISHIYTSLSWLYRGKSRHRITYATRSFGWHIHYETVWGLLKSFVPRR